MLYHWFIVILAFGFTNRGTAFERLHRLSRTGLFRICRSGFDNIERVQHPSASNGFETVSVVHVYTCILNLNCTA